MKTKNEQKGITLVALVITIIILLILAGISIASLTQTGLFEKAKEAKEKSMQAAAKEKIILAVSASYDITGKLNDNLLKENINKMEGLNEKVYQIIDPLEITVDGYVFQISSYGEIEYLEKYETKKVNLEIQPIDEDTNISTSINLSRNIVLNQNSINTLQLDGVQNQNITIVSTTDNISLEGNKIIVSQDANTTDKCVFTITGKYNSQDYTNTITAYVDFRQKVKVTDLEGNEYDAYPITSAEDLVRFRDYINNNVTDIKNAKLMNDIDLSSVCSASVGDWIPIGGDFTGIFDGNHYQISNIWVNNTSVGGKALFYSNKNLIKNLYLSGKINVSNWSGGIVVSNYGTIYQCSNATEITTTSKNIGGIATFNDGGIIKECFNTGFIRANTILASGIVDVVSGLGTIDSCYNIAKIEVGSNGAAGIIGFGNPGNTSTRTIVKNCYNIGGSNGKRISGSIMANDEEHATTRQNNYWLTGQGYSSGCDRYDGAIGTTGLGVDEMKGIAESLGDAFTTDIYGINEGYPILKWQLVRYNRLNGK